MNRHGTKKQPLSSAAEASAFEAAVMAMSATAENMSSVLAPLVAAEGSLQDAMAISTQTLDQIIVAFEQQADELQEQMTDTKNADHAQILRGYLANIKTLFSTCETLKTTIGQLDKSLVTALNQIGNSIDEIQSDYGVI